MRRIGAVDSIAATTAGSLLRVLMKAPTGPRCGFVAQTMAQGRTPLITNTAKISPHKRNHLWYFLFIVERTSAFIMALSMLLIVSNKHNPKIVTMIANREIKIKPSFQSNNSQTPLVLPLRGFPSKARQYPSRRPLQSALLCYLHIQSLRIFQ